VSHDVFFTVPLTMIDSYLLFIVICFGFLQRFSSHLTVVGPRYAHLNQNYSIFLSYEADDVLSEVTVVAKIVHNDTDENEISVTFSDTKTELLNFDVSFNLKNSEIVDI
jgi:hypothetical protein